jgi:hypothetical protein
MQQSLCYTRMAFCANADRAVEERPFKGRVCGATKIRGFSPSQVRPVVKIRVTSPWEREMQVRLLPREYGPA